MTIEELNARIGLTICEIDDISIATDECKKLSIEFAISVLEEYKAQALKYDLWSNIFDDKIQELKQYLDEKV